MRIKLLGLLFLGFIFITPFKVMAATPPPEAWDVSACFSLERCKDAGDDHDEDDTIINCKIGDSWHITRLSLPTQKLLANQDAVYITECVHLPPPDNMKCTTVNPTFDQILPVGDDNLQFLIDHIQYDMDEFKVRYYDDNYAELGRGVASLKTDAVGNLIHPDGNKKIKYIEWKSYNPDVNYARSWQIYTPIAEVAPTESPNENSIGAQQQADLTFSPVSPPIECSSVSYDPEGRVFDAITLEPIPNARVELLRRNTNGDFTAQEVADAHETSIPNPITTESSNPLQALAGIFNFYVNDGFYKLNPSHADYDFPNSSIRSSLPTNTNKIYYNLYFSDSQPIEQKGAVEHRDIPFVPKDGIGKTYPELIANVLYYSEVPLSPTIVSFTGRVSHPFAKAIVKICDANATNCREDTVITSTSQGGPDKEGNFNIRLDQSKLNRELGEKYVVSFEKIDLVSSNLTKNTLWNNLLSFLNNFRFIQQVGAKESVNSIIIEPIVSYLEGYAYDKNGKIIPNATVEIYVHFAEEPIRKIKTDANGYFKLTSEYLPLTSYSLAYTGGTGATGKTNITTSQFLAQNYELHQAEKINPYIKTTRTTDPRRNVTPTYVPQEVISVIPNPTDMALAQQPTQLPGDQATPPAEEQTSNTVALVAAVLLLLLAAAGILLAVYLYKKRMAEEKV
ncbi:hypothetical protein A3A93_02480 [Candidatus Roizmanbacteria bacterium RIFCSPLOWO2_01_FULL_38_12]|uniref:Carboxypeptidase regulatory-like domain-containing protein n=1 Tax=Candidatus Roizmanbacteria bacterium RIFCSPLOWO2_01_FULL_38_12 TaxID=1802061 RepID=A0A1F7IZZ7_9BACT|nr:MAG: hypothetical protein A3F59_06220 [Candidatus Roizmanbacteria bacterium RIFCSPHIGHO2_12_FULL_38_13]OGK48934.1 MAG: hypothetical protein A3A93_02480 [Candidatus Roizmanbacteria bacterium RIFCSPLOWO2_01_FULL_38_12]